MLKHVEHGYDSKAAPGRYQRVSIDPVDRKPRFVCGKSRGARVQLDPLCCPSGPARQMDQASDVRPYIEQTVMIAAEMTIAANSKRQLGQHATKDEVLAPGLELLFYPFLRPSLIIHAIKIPRQGRRHIRLSEPALPAAVEPEPLARILCELRVLLGVGFKLKESLMNRHEPFAAANPAIGERHEL